MGSRLYGKVYHDPYDRVEWDEYAMTLKRFQSSTECTTEPQLAGNEEFPDIALLEDGAIERAGRGIVGWLHTVEGEDAVAFCATKNVGDHYFGKFNGYAISIDVINRIQNRARDLVESGAITAAETETVYVLFFIQGLREVLQFTLEQYREDAKEWVNSGGSGPTDDPQRVMPEVKAINRWRDGFQYVVKETAVSNQAYRTL